ncbi:MAG TPA: hypothetical protein IAD15_02265 [Candidatus Fimiplasma intestinipullorum]|uniref:Uncharacterized protein n=1 Tax=Candidatus Fimiplasma intestinipullorum TaxID=2840825 RepID=A0A9D1HP46_9FIRM|nr:hypothetical protein [Candidatus Fimiplasma intestinipullorum]
MIDDYAAVAEARAALANDPFGQNGDPDKAAEVIVRTIAAKDYPHLILLGKGSSDTGIQILQDQITEIAKWKEIADHTYFEK